MVIVYNPDACSIRAAAELLISRKTVLVFVAILPGQSGNKISGSKVLADFQVRIHRNTANSSGILNCV